MSTSSIYLLLFLLTCSDAVASIIAAVFVTRRTHGSYAHYQTLMLYGIAIEASLAIASLLIWWPTEALDNPAFAIIRITGRGIKCAGVWMWALYLMGMMNGVHKDAG
jgi:hypothetical protein